MLTVPSCRLLSCPDKASSRRIWLSQQRMQVFPTGLAAHSSGLPKLHRKRSARHSTCWLVGHERSCPEVQRQFELEDLCLASHRQQKRHRKKQQGIPTAGHPSTRDQAHGNVRGNQQGEEDESFPSKQERGKAAQFGRTGQRHNHRNACETFPHFPVMLIS